MFKHAMIALAGASMPVATLAAGPIPISGRTTADETLQGDIVRTMNAFSGAFSCEGPTAAQVSVLNSAMIPSGASYRAPSLRASYEEWDATFCDKRHRFLVVFWPDPEGGSFLSVHYPYPPGAPSAIVR